jgi:hypothetical protein
VAGVLDVDEDGKEDGKDVDEEVDVDESVVMLTACSSPKFQPLIWTPSTKLSPVPIVEVAWNHGESC